MSQLLAYVRYIEGTDIQEEILFFPQTEKKEASPKAADVLAVVYDVFEENQFSWDNLVAVCTDRALAMMGSRSVFVTLVKQKHPEIRGTHCMIHRQALTAKTLPRRLNLVLEIVIKVVNYVKSSAVNTSLFHMLCKDMDTSHENLLFHRKVCNLAEKKLS